MATDDLPSAKASAGGLLSIASPIAGAALDAFGAVAGGLFSANQARKNRKFQERMYNQQVADNRENWRMVNEYNDPKNQLKRLTNSGLNPLLMYGQGGISNTMSSPAAGGTAPSGSVAHGNFQTNFGQAMYQAAIMKEQLGLMRAEREKKEIEKDKISTDIEWQEIENKFSRDTYDLRVALQHSNFDLARSIIDKNRNDIFQSSFRNAHEMASLSLQNSLAIRRQNLSEFEVGNNVLQGWENVISGRISASAQVKRAFAAMMQATTAAKVGAAQIGLMRSQSAVYDETSRFLHGSYDYRVNQEFQKMQMMKKDVSWKDVLNEAGLTEQQSRTFLNTMQSSYYNSQTEWKPIDEVMTPVNMLTGFGAGLMLNGNVGRVRVSGFGK